MARLMGRPLIPWQRSFADVAGELRPDGRLLHRFVVMIVPRRAGKSLLMLANALGVTGHRRGTRAAYLSHRRESAAALWREEWFPPLEDSPLYPRHLELRRANGSERIGWRHRYSGIRLLPPDGDALRSAGSNLVYIDEAREFPPALGAELEAGAFPTQATGWGGQTWIVSNAGDGASEWLRTWRDRARAALAAGDPTFALIEYAAPAGSDPDDPATWWQAHPGLGYHVLEDMIAADHSVMDPDTFACEYLGWWPETLIDRPLLDGWQGSIDPGAAPADPLVLAADLDTDRQLVTIAAAGRYGTAVAVELLEHGPHGAWVAPRLAELVDRWQPVAFTWDRGSPVNALAPDFEELNTELQPLDAVTVAAAAGAFHDHVIAGRVAHRDDDRLLAAVTGARRRTVAGAWTFDRRIPGAGPLLAAAFAAWVHRDGTRRPPNVA